MGLPVVNPNLLELIASYQDGKTGAILEGSSRSGKTWASIDFLNWFLATRQKGLVVNCIRETYNSFKTTLFNDIRKRTAQMGIHCRLHDVEELHSMKLFGSRINFIGADKPSKFEGATCDIAYYNELLDIPRDIFDLQEQRCQLFWIGDYNPKAVDHWVYNGVVPREDVSFFKSTFEDNPFISATEKRKILSYEPTHPEDRQLPEKERRPHPVNINQGTADDFKWKVYGLGERSAPEGLIFRYVTWIDEWPEGIEKYTYGLDFGFTNSPTALVKVGRIADNLYLQRLIYTPIEDPKTCAEAVNAAIDPGKHIWADSAHPGTIADLRLHKLRVLAAKKPKGSIQTGISLLKKFKIHIVRSPEFQKEQANYRWRMINGISLNEPVDEFNHLWDAARYATTMEFRSL
jgi:PBSX family phage terminase large subunit